MKDILWYTHMAQLSTSQEWAGLGGGDVTQRMAEKNSSYLPPHLRQTINRAELQDIIETVSYYHDYQSKLAICTDSSYVFGGVQGTALRWRAAGWVTTPGPVTNVDLCIQFKTLLDTCCPVLGWINVPSHIDILGNDRADALAERGRKVSPLYMNACHPPYTRARHEAPHP